MSTPTAKGDRVKNENDGKLEWVDIDLSDPAEIERKGRMLVGHTFRDVLDLGVAPKGAVLEYNSKQYKGGMGSLIEERWYGYPVNSDSDPDFPEAGVELKTTCYDIKKDGDLSAGERLVLTMIPYDREVALDYEASHLHHKCHTLMLIYYHRDREKDSYDQEISYAALFVPPEEDLAVIREDYRKIAQLVQEGRADELSESMTSYLGACTKGSTAAKSRVDQYYAPGKKAKKRAFCLKRSYMDYVLHHYLMNEAEADSIAGGAADFEARVAQVVDSYAGKTARELCAELGIAYTGNKAQWTTIAYRLLGARGDRAAEFEKAGISLRTIRLEEGGGLKESISLNTFEFMDVVEQTWEDSDLRSYLESTRFLFVVFQKRGDGEVLKGCVFWSMPMTDLDGGVRSCWEQMRNIITRGVRLVRGPRGITNDLPKIAEGIVHVRPHAAKAAYRLEDGSEIGDVQRDASKLPDGRAMTRQSFWLSARYVRAVIEAGLPSGEDGQP